MNETLNIQNGVSPITIDTKVTEGSTRPVMGGGIYEAIAEVAEPFVVELTPTTLDLTEGTMDKTVGEITAAWREGKRILFSLTITGLGSVAFYCNNATLKSGYSFSSFEAVFVQAHGGTPALSWFYTGATNFAELNTWHATQFLLTGA